MKKLRTLLAVICLFVFGIATQANVDVAKSGGFVLTGINELGMANFELGINLYPNPKYKIIKLEIKNYKTENLNYEFFDINGKLLQNKENEGIESIISMVSLLPDYNILKVNEEPKELKGI